MEYIFKNTHLQTFPEPIAFKILKESDVDYIKGTSFVEKIYIWANSLEATIRNNFVMKDIKGAVSRNSAQLGNYKMPVKLRET